MFLFYKDSAQFVDFPGLMNYVKEDYHGTHLVKLLSFFVEIIFFFLVIKEEKMEK